MAQGLYFQSLQPKNQIGIFFTPDLEYQRRKEIQWSEKAINLLSVLHQAAGNKAVEGNEELIQAEESGTPYQRV